DITKPCITASFHHMYTQLSKLSFIHHLLA
ncbi:hypothetical protein BVRB_017420, partial [Beta vulgaris subsp. vulgaris]